MRNKFTIAGNHKYKGKFWQLFVTSHCLWVITPRWQSRREYLGNTFFTSSVSWFLFIFPEGKSCLKLFQSWTISYSVNLVSWDNHFFLWNLKYRRFLVEFQNVQFSPKKTTFWAETVYLSWDISYMLGKGKCNIFIICYNFDDNRWYHTYTLKYKYNFAIGDIIRIHWNISTILL